MLALVCALQPSKVAQQSHVVPLSLPLPPPPSLSLPLPASFCFLTASYRSGAGFLYKLRPPPRSSLSLATTWRAFNFKVLPSSDLRRCLAALHSSNEKVDSAKGRDNTRSSPGCVFQDASLNVETATCCSKAQIYLSRDLFT